MPPTSLLKARLAHSLQALSGRTVLITGGTGSFGRAFVESALRWGSPKKLIVLSRDEQKHYQMERQVQDSRLRFFVGDIRDRDRLRTALRGVDVVVHAAAMKHVPICEYNPIEAVATNVHGARNLIEAAIEQRVDRVIALSTDKAVAPANLYGATKLCMEKLLIAANAYSGDLPTRFAVVRYGNVMGSAGSVIPLFRSQRAAGRLTITDDRMTRFWIEMPEAVALVARGLELMQGGEIFIPKLPTTDIGTLAEAMAPGVPREVVGIRPGEKLHETLISSEESRRASDLEELMVIWPEFQFHAAVTGRPGRALPEGYVYCSDSAEPRLGIDETRAMVERVA
ncbi:MAG: UDP-N-acetylglucosamine 4,6-dehydratase (inverting) [Kofleriaceae bacterium]|jgi:UDP-N-acetylglucosamine 4,6-dehydratase|nr:UDP-N-acetylglucosamine 4,6-dehydratase (inverting) [Kofleriaceae bacterium]MBP6835814.1 UDP-N-acetylglucosamine 4,6-dehydratase (inverting) [Kofleriaceae bacterium]MBP9206941.1 UDP-N-acetylglucosamine 4,6-dehydratase (inverting) [Kofleriaceae bacterium]